MNPEGLVMAGEAQVRVKRRIARKSTGLRTANYAKQSQFPGPRLLPLPSQGQACRAARNDTGTGEQPIVQNKANLQMRKAMLTAS